MSNIPFFDQQKFSNAKSLLINPYPHTMKFTSAAVLLIAFSMVDATPVKANLDLARSSAAAAVVAAPTTPSRFPVIVPSYTPGKPKINVATAANTINFSHATAETKEKTRYHK